MVDAEDEIIDVAILVVGDDCCDSVLLDDDDCTGAVGVLRGGSNVERVPTVMVDNTVVDRLFVGDRREVGGRVAVASGRGAPKEPVIPSILKKGEKAA